MNILITGGNFYNKGGELMLVTLTDNLKTHLPDATICVSPFLGNAEKLRYMKIKVLNYPLYHYGDKKFFKKALRFPFLFKSLLLMKGKKIRGEVAMKDIDVVLDISGFAFGEKWGSSPLNNLTLFTRKMKKMGVKFFLMPQAFGPFTKDNMSGDINKVVHNVHLVIARDEQSFSFVKEKVTDQADQQKIVLFPDITLTFKKLVLIDDEAFQNPFCIIVPNERMLDKASERWQKNYYYVLSKLIDIILTKSNLNIVMLIHAVGQSADALVGRKAIESVRKIYSGRIIYYVEEDPVRLKSIISKSTFLIGSRFHALASALSLNIPAIATSWLHKYEMLFQDYDVKEFSFKEPDDEIYERVESLLNEEYRNIIQNRLKIANSLINEKSKAMWNLILSMMKS